MQRWRGSSQVRAPCMSQCLPNLYRKDCRIIDPDIVCPKIEAPTSANLGENGVRGSEGVGSKLSERHPAGSLQLVLLNPQLPLPWLRPTQGNRSQSLGTGSAPDIRATRAGDTLHR